MPHHEQRRRAAGRRPVPVSSACTTRPGALRAAADAGRAGQRCATAPGSTWPRSGTRAATTTAASRRWAGISGTLPPELEAERAAPAGQRADAPGPLTTRPPLRLRNWQGPQDWMAFARFNLGVALVRQDRLAEAAPFLTAVGTHAIPTAASCWRCATRPIWRWASPGCRPAIPPARCIALERVRLTGPYATRALLGAGLGRGAAGSVRRRR